MAGRRRKNPLQIRAYSVQEICDQFDFHPNTVRLWVHRDGLRHYRKGPGGKILIREDDLNEFLDRFYHP
ncbi:helix-turn-helix domain-containing protein [Chloroflexota bacterium]